MAPKDLALRRSDQRLAPISAYRRPFPPILKVASLSTERSLDTVVRAVSAAILPVWVDFTSLKGLPCAPGQATTRRGMLVTNG